MNPLEIFQDIPNQFDYYSTVKMPDLSSFKGTKKIIICAMGGSAFPVDILADHIKEKYKRDIVFVNRDYELPYWVDSDTLVIAASFSGSTEETLSCMQEAITNKNMLLGISMGGEISRICSSKNIPYIALPKVVMPRFGAGYMVSTLLRLLTEMKLIPQQDEELSNLKVLLEPLTISIQKSAESLAKSLEGRFITVYSDQNNATSAMISRIALNETGKIVAYNNIFSESNHNELASFKFSTLSHAFLLLSYPTMNPRILKRFDLMNELLPDRDILCKRVNANFESSLYRNAYYVMFFSYLSYYLAVNAGHDPVEIDIQESLKRLLKK